MTLPSATSLGSLLFKHGFVPKPFTTDDLKNGRAPRNVTDETYGSESYVYVGGGDRAGRRRLEALAKAAGFKVNENYWPKSTCAEIRVSYFKGWHWDE